MTAGHGVAQRRGEMGRSIGVCSWSLPSDDAAGLVDRVAAVGIDAVQLALDPLRTGEWSTTATVDALGAAGIAIRSGMMRTRDEDYSTLESIRRTGGVVPDEHWEANLAAATENARLAAEIGIKLVTLHAGFIPHDRRDRLRVAVLQRIAALADRFASAGVCIALETGQETADTLTSALDELDRPDVGVNFDPANMILYGMGDPVEALKQLAPRVAQIHIKDAVATCTPGTWGSEVPVGQGDVDWLRFFDVVRETNLDCGLVIERESRGDNAADIRQAHELIQRYAGESHE